MDRTTARSYIASKVEDPDQTRFTLAQYNNAVDLAQQEFSIDARAIIQTNTSTVLVAGTAEYSLPSDFLVAIMFRHNGIKLAPTTKYELSFQSGQDWSTIPNGTPVCVYTREENTAFGLVPAPDANAATYTLSIDYIAIPAALSSDSSTLLNGLTILQYYAPAVINWAAQELLTYVPQTAEIQMKRAALLKDYERYRDQAISTYKNMVDEPLKMSGGQIWQDNTLRKKYSAFSD